MGEIVIRPLDQIGATDWDDYVQRHADGTFFHLSGWQAVITKAYGHRCYFVGALLADELIGVLPLAHVKSWLFGNSLVSTPFCVYGGPVADSEDAAKALVDHAVALAKKLKVDVLEIRSRDDRMSAWRDDNWVLKDLHVTFRKPITDDQEANLSAIPRKQRAMVRKGIKAELEYAIDSDPQRFVQMYSESVRNLGTPVFPKKYFRILQQEFGEDCDILTVTKDGQPVTSVMNFYFRDEVLPYYGGGTEAARALKANDFMYYALMGHASSTKGSRLFDYGRSKQGVGSYSFKKNWGFEPQPLYYAVHLIKAKEVPEINPLNPKYQMFIKVWKKLPVWLSQIIGPFLSRSLG